MLKKISSVYLLLIILFFGTTDLSFAATGKSTVRDVWFSFRDLNGNKFCSTDARIFIPKSNSIKHNNPAVIVEHGFLEAKEASEGMGKYLASQGYIAVTYSALGFGKSTCGISMDDRFRDGLAVKEIVDYLSGKNHFAFTDQELKNLDTRPLYVAGKGSKRNFDPLVGMLGQSYGGAVQLAASSIDSRIDTIIPINTFSDLRYSLVPDGVTSPAGVRYPNSGITKRLITPYLALGGMTNPISHNNLSKFNGNNLVCPNYQPVMCSIFAKLILQGYGDASSLDTLYQHSPSFYIKKVKIPALVIQSENDILFNLQESLTTFKLLPNRQSALIWAHNGHGFEEVEKGNFDYNHPDRNKQYLIKRILDWLDGHLQSSNSVSDKYGKFEWFRNWIKYSARADKAYGKANSLSVLNNYKNFRFRQDNASIKIPFATDTNVLGSPKLDFDKK